MSVLGLARLHLYLGKKNNNIAVLEKAGLTKAAAFMQSEVKASIAGRRAEHVSVDTGRFLNSVNFQVGNDDAVIFSNVPYADFLEFGTTSFQARPHFRNSKARNQKEAIGIINKEIKKA